MFARHARRRPPRDPRLDPGRSHVVTLTGGVLAVAVVGAGLSASAGLPGGVGFEGPGWQGTASGRHGAESGRHGEVAYPAAGRIGTGELTVLHDDGTVSRLPAGSPLARRALTSGARAAGAGVRAVGLTLPVRALGGLQATTRPSPSAAELARAHHLQRIGAQRAWQAGQAGAGVTVAVLDSGIDRSHQDLAGQVVGQADCTGRRGCTTKVSTATPYWHGTHVAGVIAAAANGKGVVGVAPRARLLDVRVLDANGRGDTAMVTAGVEWAVRQGAKILNLSIGSPGDDPALHAAIRRATARGVLVTAAAGNDFDPCAAASALSYPAAYPEVISVAAATEDGGHAWFSSVNGYVDITAPGASVVSDSPGNQVSPADGTSVAAPQVSGAAADVWSGHPTWTAARVRAELERTASDLGAPGRDDVFGVGLVQAAAGTAAVNPAAAQPQITLAVPSDVRSGRPAAVTVRVTAPGGIPACRATVTLQTREAVAGAVWRPVARLVTGEDGSVVGRLDVLRRVGLRAVVSGPSWLPPGTSAEAVVRPTPVLQVAARRSGPTVLVTVRTAPAAQLTVAVQRFDPTRRVWADLSRTRSDARGVARFRLPAGKRTARIRVVSAASPDWPATAGDAFTARVAG